MSSRVVIVGASMGGLRAAESLRRFGYTGAITVIGDEPYAPYNRPPLSKEVLAAEVSHDAVAFELRAAVADVDWLLGTAAVAADPSKHTVTVADGRHIAYSKLVIATGLRAKRADYPNPVTAGRFTIRSLDDAVALRAAITPGVRVVVSGAGFIGCEVAATVRKLGAEVTIVAPNQVPLERILGSEFGAEIQRRQEAAGVRFVLGRRVADVRGVERVTGVLLDDGSELDCDVVIDAVGSLPNTEWLQSSGLDVSDGVRTDPQLRALREDGSVEPDVYVVGDVARFPNPAFDAECRRVEHWNIPTECAKHVGNRIAKELSDDAEQRSSAEDLPPFAPVPSFWSDQFDMHILAFGLPVLADEARVVAGDLSNDFVCEYYRGGELVGAAGIGLRSTVQGYRTKFAPAR